MACVSHPQAFGIVESEKFGNIRSEIGPAGYVLSVGVKNPETGMTDWTIERVTL